VYINNGCNAARPTHYCSLGRYDMGVYLYTAIYNSFRLVHDEAMTARQLFHVPPAVTCTWHTVKNIRTLSTDILWRVFCILTEPVPCTFVSVNRRNNEARAHNAMLKYEKLATKYSWTYGYYLQCSNTTVHCNQAQTKHCDDSAAQAHPYELLNTSLKRGPEADSPAWATKRARSPSRK